MILVYGLAVAGAATVRALRQRGLDVVAVDDPVDDAKRRARRRPRRRAGRPGPTTTGSPRSSPPPSVVVPAPGVPETHRLFDAARRAGRPVRQRDRAGLRVGAGPAGGPRPMLAVTGTDGKTTTTLWAVEMLGAGGVRSVAAGNTDVPLVAALDLDVDAFVVECTSFRLAWTEAFRGDAAAWLNLAPDHLNWHVSMDTYEAAKARMFSQQRPDDVAIGFAADPVVMAPPRGGPGPPPHVRTDRRRLPRRRSRRRRRARRPTRRARRASPTCAGRCPTTSPTASPPPRSCSRPGSSGPPRSPPAWRRSSVRRTASSSSARPTACAGTTTPRPRPRTPRRSAIRAFDHVVLIAGGLNKGLDLAPMAAEAARLRPSWPSARRRRSSAPRSPAPLRSSTAASMAEAVERAGAAARPGDVVLLSPGCASFDWYPDGGYPARGDDFRRLVARNAWPRSRQEQDA